MATDEETFKRLVVELNLLEEASNEFQTRLNIIDTGLAEMRLAASSLEGLKSEAKGSSIFVPIGGGSYVKAEVSDVENIIVGVGAGVVVEKTIKEATESVGKKLAELEGLRQSVQKQLLQVLQRMEEVRTKINDLSSKLAEGKRKRSV